MEDISKEILEILEIMNTSIMINCPENEIELERIKKIKEYIEQKNNIDE